DPRVKTPALGLTEQFTLSKQMYDGILEAQTALQQVRSRRASLSGDPSRSAESLALQRLEGQPAGRGAATEGPETFTGIIGSMNQLMGLLQGADVTPTTQLVAAVANRRTALAKLMAQWDELKKPMTAPARP